MQFTFSQTEGAIEEWLKDLQRETTKAKEGAVKDVGKLAIKEGRANITAGGFRGKWRSGLKSRFYANRDTGDPAVFLYHNKWQAIIFERGVVIGGKPILWLPVERNLPAGIESPKEYGKKLVSVNVAGKPPLLFDAQNRLLGPLFWGARSVSLRKRLDLYRIFAAAAEHMKEFFEERFNKS